MGLKRVKSARFHSSVQFEGGLGAKSKIIAGECGCELFKDGSELIIKLPKYEDQVVTTGIMVMTLVAV